MEGMIAVVLAGGKGTRISSVVPDLPKPMVPIGGRPFLERIFDLIDNSVVEDVVVSVGYLSSKIIDHFGDNYRGLKLHYSVETEPLGTGGAVLQASAQIQDDFFLVLNGDSILELQIDDLLEYHKKHKKSIVVVSRVEDVSRYGQVSFDDRIHSFSEKTGFGVGYINTGIYILSKEVFRLVESRQFSLENLICSELANQEFIPYEVSGRFIDIGTPVDLKRAESFFDD